MDNIQLNNMLDCLVSHNNEHCREASKTSPYPLQRGTMCTYPPSEWAGGGERNTFKPDCFVTTNDGRTGESQTRFQILFGVVILLVIMLFPPSCITPFEPVGVRDSAGILVVEGMILEEGTTIKLSRTVKLDEKLSRANFTGLDNATIHVIDESTNSIAVAEPQVMNEITVPGTYVINGKISFTPGMKYALDIKIGNKHYRSAFVSPVRTPEIDEVSWLINDDKSMEIMVSTHDPANEIKYYRWSFEEDWEIRATLFAPYRYDPLLATIIEQNLYTANNRYYCWDSDVSKSILLGATEKLTEAVIKDKPIHRIPANNSRFSYLYSILVKQYGLDKEAYAYFENVRKNVEDSGSIFSPQPTEKTGNIRCLSDPDEVVIGYIAISKETTSRIFVNVAYLMTTPYECDEENMASLLVSEMPVLFNNGWGIYEFNYYSREFLAVARSCVDCTLRGGTKNKPDFWPNDHQ